MTRRGRSPNAERRRQRVLFVLPNLVGGGAERFAVDLVQELQRHGIDTELFLWLGGSAQLDLPPEQKVHHGYGSKEMNHRAAFARSLRRLIRITGDYDVLLAALELDSTFLAWAAAAVRRRPVVGVVQIDLRAYLRAYPSRVRSALARRIYPRLDAVVAVSAGAAASARALGAPPERTRVIHNAIDLDRIRRLAEAPSAPDGAGPVVVGIGRLTLQKRFDLLIRAHARALREGAAHRLVILGEGPDRDTLVSLAKELGVEDTVEIAGFVANPYPRLASADLFCLSSEFEGFGLVVAEALALGVPVVATDCPSGPSEVLQRGRYGELVEVGSENALAVAIRRHLREPERLRRKAAMAADWVSLHSIERAGEAYAALIERATSDSRSPNR